MRSFTAGGAGTGEMGCSVGTWRRRVRSRLPVTLEAGLGVCLRCWGESNLIKPVTSLTPVPDGSATI